jgi:GH24 family phage-related lysozyme (muramidase)
LDRDSLERQWTARWEAANEASFGADPPGPFDALIHFAQKYGQAITQGDGVAPGFRGTHASVANSFVSWSTPLEGMTDYPYTDAEGLVTVGMGNLIDAVAPGQKMHVNCGHGTSVPCGMATPTAKALALPWAGDIHADWARIKAAWPGVQSTACKGITSARLPKSAVSSIILGQLKNNESAIMAGLPNFAEAPADAQLAAHSMAWAMGPGFAKSWTQFRNAFNAGDYATAAAQSHMRGVGIDMRNLANKLLLINAAAVKASGANFDHLYYIDGISQLAQHAVAAGAAMSKAAVTSIARAASDNSTPLIAGGLLLGGLFVTWRVMKK